MKSDFITKACGYKMLFPGLFAKWSIVEIVKQRTLLKDLSSLFRNISISLSPILLLITELVTLRGHSFVSCRYFSFIQVDLDLTVGLVEFIRLKYIQLVPNGIIRRNGRDQ